MSILTIVLIVLLLPVALFGLLAFLRYQRRPKFRRGPLKPLERRLLEALVANTDAPLADRLRRQIPLLTEHCRLQYEKSSSLELYPANADRPALEQSDVAFPNTSDFRLATLSFKVRDQPFTAQVSATGGRLFGLTIRPNCRRVLGASEIEVIHCKSGKDAFKATGRIVHEPIEPTPAFEGFLGEWARRFEFGSVYRPLDQATAARALAQIDATLPPDYLEMMRQTDGFRVGDWHVLGLAEVHSVPLGEHNYYYLADDGITVACVREGSKTAALYVCAMEDADPEPTQHSLRTLIETSLDDRPVE